MKRMFPNIWACLSECQTSVSQTQRHICSWVVPLKPIMCLQDRWCVKDWKTLLLFHSLHKSSGTWTYLEFTGFSPPLGSQPKLRQKDFHSYILLHNFPLHWQNAELNVSVAIPKIVVHFSPLRWEVTSLVNPQLSNYSHPDIPCHT